MMRHHPVLYAFEEQQSSLSSNNNNNDKPIYQHVAGVNDLAPSFRSTTHENDDDEDNFHFLSAGRDGKLLEWKMHNNNNRHKKTKVVPSSPNRTIIKSNKSSAGAVSIFKPHADWVNCVLPIPEIGFVTGGADNILRITTVCPTTTTSPTSSPIATSSSVNRNKNKNHKNDNGDEEEEEEENLLEYTTHHSESFKHHSGTVKSIAWLNHFDNATSTASTEKSFSYDRLAMCSSDGSVSTLQIRQDDGSTAVTHKVLTGFVGSKSAPVCLAPGTNPTSTFYIGTANGVVHSVDIRSKCLNVNEVIEEAHGGLSVVRDMLFYENKNILVTAGSDSLIRLWDMRHVMDPLVSIDAHGDAVWKLQKYNNNNSCFSSSKTNRKNRFYCGFNNNANESNAINFLSAGREGTVQIHSISTCASNNNNNSNNNFNSTSSSSSSSIYKTCILAQASHPVISFLHHQNDHHNKLFVGTCTSDILEFDLTKNNYQNSNNNNNKNSDFDDDDDDNDKDDFVVAEEIQKNRNKSKSSSTVARRVDDEVYLPNQTPDVSQGSSDKNLQQQQKTSGMQRRTSTASLNPIPNNNNNSANNNGSNTTNKNGVGILLDFIQIEENGQGGDKSESNFDADDYDDDEDDFDLDEQKNNNNDNDTITNILLLSPFKPQRTEARNSSKWATPIFNIITTTSMNKNNTNASDQQQEQQRPPIQPRPSNTYKGGIGIIQTATFPTRIHVAALHTNGEISVYDYVKCAKVATFSGNVRFDEDVVTGLEMLPGLCPSWCQVGCNWGCITVTMSESESNGSFLNGWELEYASVQYMKRLIEEIEVAAATKKSTSTSSSPALSSPTTSGVKFFFDNPPSQTQFGLETLRGLRTPRNVVTWAFQTGIVPAAKENRISKFIIKNLACHLSDDDKRSQFELPVEQIAFCENFVINMLKRREYDDAVGKLEQNTATTSESKKTSAAMMAKDYETSSSSSGPATKTSSNNSKLQQPQYLPAPSPAVPRWLLVLAERKITIAKDPSSQTVSFTCEPHPNPPPGFKKIGSAFESKDKNRPPSISFPRCALLSDVCALIHKNLKKSSSSSVVANLLSPSFAKIQELRNKLLSYNNNQTSKSTTTTTTTTTQIMRMNPEGIIYLNNNKQINFDRSNPPSDLLATAVAGTTTSTASSSNSNKDKDKEVVQMMNEVISNLIQATAEEFIVLFNGTTNTIIDPSLLLCSSNAIFREGRLGFNIKYAAIGV